MGREKNAFKQVHEENICICELEKICFTKKTISLWKQFIHFLIALATGVVNKSKVLRRYGFRGYSFLGLRFLTSDGPHKPQP